MMKNIYRVSKNYYKLSKEKDRYGLDKPVFIVAAITLAVIFVSVYFGSVSGWLDNALNQFSEDASTVGPDP